MIYAIDLETTGLNTRTCEIVCVAVWDGKKGQVFFDAIKDKKKIASIIENKANKLVFWNATFDVPILQRYGFKLDPDKVYDAMIEKFLLRAGLGSLKLKDTITEVYKIIPQVYKEVDFNDKGALSTYALQDVKFTWQLHKKYMEELSLKDNAKLMECYDRIYRPLINVVIEFDRTGLRVDLKMARNKLDDLMLTIRRELKKIYAYLPRTVNIDSPEQMSVILFRKLKLKPYYDEKGKSGFYSVGKDQLAKMKSQHPILENILSYRKAEKLRNTYLQKYVDGKQSRIWSDFNICGTVTGRFSSSDPNFQNIPVSMREIFVADPGCKFIIADYNQLELRLMAHRSQEPAMLKAYQTGVDIHQQTLDVLRQISPHADRRDAKGVNFGFMYGMGAERYADKHNVDIAYAEQARHGFFNLYNRLPSYYDRVHKFVLTNGYSATIFGRRRFYDFDKVEAKKWADKVPFKRYGHPFYKECAEGINHTIQGSAGDVMNLGCVKLYEELWKRKWLDKVKFSVQVHDEIIMQTPNALVGQGKKLLAECFEHKGKDGKSLLSIPLIMDIEVDARWVKK